MAAPPSSLPPVAGDGPLRRLRAWTPAVTTSAAVGLIGWLGWAEMSTVAEQRLAERQVVQATELRGSISHLDEMLTLLAQTIAQTGDRRWADRYEEVSPKLDAAVAQAVALASPSARDALESTAGEAHSDLVTMERRAIALAGAGERDAAQALLGSAEFDYLHSVYAAGLDVFGDELRALTAARAETLNGRTWMQAGGLGLSAVLLAAAALATRGRGRLRRALDRAETVARTDALTDLPNRRHLREVLGESLAGNDGTALLIVGLDRFKDVNGARGHAVGDRLLQLAAVRLKTALRPTDVVARLGGDEFALMVSVAEDGRSHMSNAVAHVARRVTAALGQPFEPMPGIAVQLGASIGVTLCQAGQDADTAIQHASIALDRAKRDARGGLRFFEPGMDARLRERASLEAELRQAIAEDAIVPHFQPLVDLTSGRLVGVEMLARWPHPKRGMVSPGEFIPLAEDTGLIAPMTERLMRRACRAAAQWPDPVVLACNISPLQLRDPEFPAVVRTILDQTGFPPHRLELEVTESALVGDLALARRLLDQLRSLGISLALDDFGTGYSSLRHLQTLPFDKLKIDASFVGAMARDGESAKIVTAVVALGHNLGLVTVGEGIETEAVAAGLREIGCDVGQGWFYGRPGPAETIHALIADRRDAVTGGERLSA